MQKVHCDGCGAGYEVDPRRVPPGGMKMRCPGCGASFQVQSESDDDLFADLPAPASGGGLELDLPALKSQAAPAPGIGLPDADLPAPKVGDADLSAGRPSLGAFSDLPGPRPSAPEVADLPAPKAPTTGRGKPARAGTRLGMAPPQAAGADDTRFDGLDLPAPKAGGAFDADADLPAPKAGGAFDADADLPAPKAGGAFDANADLPAARAPTQGAVDLPAAKPAVKLAPDFPGGAQGADLPAPKEPPSKGKAPRRSFGRPSGGAKPAAQPGTLPKDSLAMDPGPVGDALGAPDPFGEELDLPGLKQAAPANEAGPGASGDADLPELKASAPTSKGKPPPAATRLGLGAELDGLDLPAPKGKAAQPGGASVPKDSLDIPTRTRSDGPLAPPFEAPRGPQTEPLAKDSLDLPAPAQPRAARPAPSVTPKDSLDLDLPRATGAPAPRPVQGTNMGIGRPAPSVTPKDSLDLPAPAPQPPAVVKGAPRAPQGTTMGLGGSLPKDSLDLPAPAPQPPAVVKGAPRAPQGTTMGLGGSLPKDSLDLPAPADLPAATARGVPPQGTDMGLGAPFAEGGASEGSLDLPAPADLPTAAGAANQGSVPKDSLDLPAPADLPTTAGAASQGSVPKDSLDLPSPGALPTADALGTPAMTLSGATGAATNPGLGNTLPKDSLDLPSPGALDALGTAETDLGIGGGTLDGATLGSGPLPKPSGPAPGGGFELGASLPKDSLDLPSPGALGGAPETPGAPPGLGDSLDLPSPGAAAGGLGAGTLGGADPLVPSASVQPGQPSLGGTMDLSAAELANLKIESAPPKPTGAGELPLPEMSGARPFPTGALDVTGAEEDPFAGLGGDSSIPQPVRAPSAAPGGDSFAPAADAGFDEDPFGGIAAEPDAPGAGPEGAAAGRDHFGELDLGFGDDVLDTDDGPALDTVSEPAPVANETAAIEDELLGGDEVPAAAQTQRKKRKRDYGAKKKIPAWTWLVALVVVFVGAGVTLGAATPYGYFGVYLVEQLLPAAGDPVRVRAAIDQAEARAQSDTYVAVRESLRLLSDARNEAGLNRELLSRSLLHEGLYQLRFGEDTGSAQRSSAILARILDRGGDVPGLDLARAAESARRGALQEAKEYLAKVPLGKDPYRDLVEGEIALRERRFAAAVTAFSRALANGGQARASWGLARAHLGAKQTDRAAETVDATLRMSPRHADALVAAARLAKDAGELERALELTRKATGRVVINGGRARASRAVRAAGWNLEGEIEELREHTKEAHHAFEQALKAAPLNVAALLGSGRTLLRMARPRDALARFDSALSAKPSETPGPDGRVEIIDATVGAAQSLLALERERDALARLSKLAPKFGDHPDLNLWLGRAYEALREFDQAEQRYRAVIEKAPDRFDGYLALSQLLFSRQRGTEAAKVLEDAAGKVEDGAEVRRMLGHSELTRNRLDAAIEQFNAALEFDPKDGGALYGLAMARRQQGEIELASQALDRLAAADPAFPGLEMERGLLHEARGDYALAVEAYRTALKARPHDLDLRLRLGAALVTAGQVDDADQILRKVLKERPTSAEAEHFVGRVLFARHETDQALAHFERAVNLDITKAEYHLYVAWASVEQGNLTRALEAVAAAIERDPALGDAYWLRGRIELRTGQVRDALEDFSKALKLKPGRHEALANMGEAYDQLRELRRAVRAYEAAVERVPERGEWWYRLGRLHLDRGKRSEASQAIERAVILGDKRAPAPPWLADAHRLYGDLLKDADKDSEALVHYERYLALAPDNAIDREGVRKLVRRMKRRLER